MIINLTGGTSYIENESSYLSNDTLSYVIVKTINDKGEVEKRSIGENELYVDRNFYNLDKPDNVSSMVELEVLYGFDFFRTLLRNTIPYEKGKDTSIILFDAWGAEKIIIPDGVVNLELYGCPTLKEIELPDSLEQLTIIKCRNLQSIHIPDNVHTLKLSKNKFGNNFNIPIHIAELTVDVNLMGEEVLQYIDNKYVKVTLVANNITLGN